MVGAEKHPHQMGNHQTDKSDHPGGIHHKADDQRGPKQISLPAAVQVSNLWLAMAKSVVFGVFIALIGCHWGLRVKPNTQSLGEGTTASVVSAITMVIIVDAVFAVAFRSVGF